MINISLKEFRKKYGPWWGRFSSAVFATVCGISLTFGITYWKTMKEKEKLAHTCEVWAMSNIGHTIQQTDVYIDDLNKNWKTVNAVLELYKKDSINSCPDTLARDFISIFVTMHVYQENELGNMPFRNLELTRDANDIRTITGIHELYRLSKVNDDFQKSIYTKFYEFGNLYMADYYCNDNASFRTFVNAILKDNKTNYYLSYIFPRRIYDMEEFQKVLKAKYKKELKILNITKKEMDEFNTTIFEGAISVEYK